MNLSIHTVVIADSVKSRQLPVIRNINKIISLQIIFTEFLNS